MFSVYFSSITQTQILQKWKLTVKNFFTETSASKNIDSSKNNFLKNFQATHQDEREHKFI